MKIWQMLFSPNGRIRRRDYWIYELAATAVFVLVYMLVFRPAGISPVMNGALMTFIRTGQISPVMVAAYAAFVLGAQYVQFCLHAKRWHDRNRPTILAAILVGVNILNLLLSYLPRDRTGPVAVATALTYGAALVMGLWALVECGCLDGMKEANRYGPSPKYPVQAPDVF